jgi:hypothetical protein
MMGYGCEDLDGLDACKRVVCWHNGKGEKPVRSFYTPNQMRKKVSGIVFSKYVNGERIRVTFEDDHKVGNLLRKAVYSNGYTEEFEYEYKEAQ